MFMKQLAGIGKRAFAIAAVAIFAILPPTGADAEQSADSGGSLGPQQLMMLFQWAAKLTRRTLPAGMTMPVVSAMSAEQINERVCPENPTRCRPIAAAYGIEHRDIIYRDTLDLSRLLDRSYLLHEFVHYLQHEDLADAVNESCQQILVNERQAYRAQAAYLRHHGVYHPVGSELGLIRCPPEQMQIARQESLLDHAVK